MPITDKTRKILWGRSGNRCAICRLELVIQANSIEQESIVGEECHIASGQSLGPRHDPQFPPDQVDQPENLLLLCRIHHKMVDDQRDTYTAKVMRALKAQHENWVASTLAQSNQTPRIRVRRLKGETPAYLVRLTSGSDLMKLVAGAHAFGCENDQPVDREEVDLLADFFQEVRDWADLSGDFEMGDRVRAEFRMDELISELEQRGFWVFGARETQQLEGGTDSRSPWHVAHLRAVRSTSDEILKVSNPSPAPTSAPEDAA